MTAMSVSTTLRPAPSRSMAIAVVGGLACAFAIGKTLPVTMDTISGALSPLCATAAESSPLDKVEPIGSYALPNVPGKRVHDRARVLRPRRVLAAASSRRIRHRLHHQRRDPLSARRRSGRDVRRWPVLLRAARLDASGLGQCQHHGAGGTDRRVCGRRGRAADDVAGLIRSPGERSDTRGSRRVSPGCRFAHPGNVTSVLSRQPP
ncbi:hypothetical protein ACVWWO_009477 [Bradyrhizobium sp. F1.13.1]